MPKRIVSFIEVNNEMTEETTSVLLQYEPAREIYFQRQRERLISECPNETFSPPMMTHMEAQISYASETWNIEQINDFVRKLGFLEAQSADVEQSVIFFQQMNQVNINMLSYVYVHMYIPYIHSCIAECVAKYMYVCCYLI